MDDLDLAIEVVRKGASVAASCLDGRLSVRQKGVGLGIVSNADVAAERAIVDLLAAHRPGDGVLAEEGTRAQGARTWVVDPIDGTENFLVGDPHWCSAVALKDPSGSLLAAVHHPAAGDTFWALRGAGAWHDGRRMVVSDRPLARARLATFIDTPDEELPVLAGLLNEVGTTRMWGSGTLELAWLANGRLDAWVQRDVLPWDWLPGALLVRESGGDTAECAVGGGIWSVACSSQLGPGVLETLRRNGSRRPTTGRAHG